MRFDRLTPTLATIERGLFGGDVAAADPETSEAQHPQHPVAMGAALRAWIERQARSAPGAAALAGQAPQPGDIWWLALDEGTHADVALLIGRVDEARARGWLVAGETLYASDRDWVLQQDDVQSELDPRLGMVQLWNAIDVSRDQLREPSARLCDGVLDAVERVAAIRHMQHDLAPSAGRIGLVESEGVSWVSGTPLGAIDSRRRYQHLYRRLAASIDRTATAVDVPIDASDTAASGRIIPIDAARRQRRAWVNADFWRGAGLAATVLLAVGLPYIHGQRTTNRRAIATMRGLETQRASVTFDVHFASGTTLAQLTALLQEGQMRIVSGPDARAAYRVEARASTAQTARKLLNASALVVSWSQVRR
jgi:hypothetical protein